MRLAELIVVLELHQQGMTVSAIARRTGLHRSTVAKYIARGIEPPAYGPRSPRPTKLTPFERYLRERIAAVPELTGSRLCREIRGLGYAGGYTALKDFLRQVRPRPAAGFEIRFETPAGRQAQMDFAHFRTGLYRRAGSRADSGCSRSCSPQRMVWAASRCTRTCRRGRRCHADAFAELGDVPAEILYDRMRTVFHRDRRPAHAARPRDARSSGATHRTRPARHHRGDRALLAEELTNREGRRIKAALQMARLTPIKTLAGFDFSFQRTVLQGNRMIVVGGTRSGTRTAP